MSQKTTYRHPKITLCIKCGGDGIQYKYPSWDLFKQTEPKVEPCHDCNGTGRVVVSKEIITTVTPYDPEQLPKV